ncbi:MAG TPA: NAD(P)/FAD-dependent oxidoreductase [Ilumatobacter sp.]|nr:NAD(P)/FAD-dependent oxidoreductase [Ilumatobacter sp.]
MSSELASDITADVTVVGAGPSGTAAAITLARAGRTVRIIDKAVFPRDKCCGDGLTTLALRELDLLGLEPDSVEGWFDIDGARLRSPGGREVVVPLAGRGLFAAVAPRASLDHELVHLARREGVIVHEGCGFAGIRDIDGSGDDQLPHGVLVDTVSSDVGNSDVGTIATRYVIGADGMWSAVRKSVGAQLSGYRGEWHAFRQYARSVTGSAANELIVWFEPDLLPGYAWSFPLPGNRANIGFGVLRDGERRVQDMAATWRDLLQRPHIVEALGAGFEMEGRHTAWPIPARVDEVSITRGRVLFVGDAAAATDVMTGEGIGQAILTGRLAAEAIIDAGALQPEVAAHQYERAVEHHLFADHRMSKRLGTILGHRRGVDAAIGIVSRSGTWGQRNFARWMFEDEPRAIATSPSKWHRQMFKRPGAYENRVR